MGYMIGLDTAGKGLAVGQKTVGMHGDLAPLLWTGDLVDIDEETRQRLAALPVKPGTREAQDLCLEYVQQDTVLTAAVYDALIKQGHIYWTTARGTRSYKPWRPTTVDGRLKTVSEALQTPEPDTSWMTAPRERAEFYEWVVLAEEAADVA